MKEQTITIPDGFKLEKISETEYKIVPTEKKLPKTWEEFCASQPIQKGECLVTSDSELRMNIDYKTLPHQRPYYYRNLLPSKEKAEAILALCQLIQLRDCYNDGWKPEWTAACKLKHCISYSSYTWCKATSVTGGYIFVFKTEELRDEFYRNFKDLLDKLKPLYQ